MSRSCLSLVLAVCLACLALPALAETAPAAPAKAAAKPEDRKPEQPPAKEPTLNKEQQRILEQTEKLFAHLKTLFGLLGQNQRDCPAAIRAGEGFVNELGPEIRKIAAELQQAETKLSPAEKEAVTKIVQQRAEALMMTMQNDLIGFVQACPAEASKLGELLQRLLEPTTSDKAQ